MFLVGTFGIACAAILVRWALPAPPVVSAFWRVAFAVAVLAAALALRGRRLALPAGVRWPALAAGVCFGLDMALWNSALVETSVADATFLVNTTPLWVGLHAVAVLREPPGRRFLAGGALALLGTALLLGDDLGRAGSLRGDAMALGAGAFYAAYLILVKRVRGQLDAVRVVLGVGAAATVTLGVVAALRGDAFFGHPARSWACFVALALVSHLGGVLGIVWALRHLRATFASVALLAQPVGTALLGLALLGEGLSMLQLLGGAGVGAGIWLAAREAAPPPGAPPRPGPAAPDGPHAAPGGTRSRRATRESVPGSPPSRRTRAPSTTGRSPEGRSPRSS